MASTLNSKVIVVLGGTGGIGSQLCRDLREAGARLVIAGHHQDKVDHLCRELDAKGFQLDATDAVQVDDCFDFAMRECDRIDGAVNCVGSVFLKPAHRTNPDDYHRVVALNLDTAFFTVRSATSRMQNEGGSIVLVSSAAAQIGLANHESIAAAKAGIIGLTKAAAASYAKRGIRVNCVAPGLVETPASEQITASEKTKQYSLDMHPLGRIGKAEDVASAITWLLDGHNDWVTGQVLGVDGGLGMLKAHT
ncbi:SDR family oxidoreductase [Persicimonas caeni]|uniref:SDR family oxidoreductase n=1 Tax=Persicimonas caeni TaxID=2292766 RepID=A0A4Y6PYP9_PERCE|nr:SDR family oxidoreductase [Persicimonas caeni]QDG53446.1 SDR family oxidoreductase [Persicimonas caeni]QED34667.1 SDR family oxidoreductase [Persicimonas caeni]